MLWRTNGDVTGGPSENYRRTLPVVDPVMGALSDQWNYFTTSRLQRSTLAHRYLHDWNNETLISFDHEGKLSQFSNLWRGFTCGQLKQLLEVEYPHSNLLHVIRTNPGSLLNTNAALERDFTFIGVAYSPKAPETLPGLFKNPLASDSQAFAQLMLFVPRPKLRKGWRNPNAPQGTNLPNYGGVPGHLIDLPSAPANANATGPDDPGWQPYVYRESGRRKIWDALNQNWTVQLMPAQSDSLVTILRTSPRTPQIPAQGFKTSRLPGLRPDDLRNVNQH